LDGSPSGVRIVFWNLKKQFRNLELSYALCQQRTRSHRLPEPNLVLDENYIGHR
jgi:hypothetical protein